MTLRTFLAGTIKNTKVRVLKVINATERYHYQNIVMPFPVKNRDIFVKSKIYRSQSSVTILTKSGHEVCSRTPLCQSITKSGNVMVKKLTGKMSLTQKNNGVNLTWVQYVEPGENIPSWLVNKLLVDVPFNTLQNLKNRLK